MSSIQKAISIAVCASFAAVRLPAAEALAQNCGLPNAVPPEARRNITLLGQQFPLGLQLLEWPSAILAASLFEILVTEIFGINVRVFAETAASVQAIWALGGCTPQFAGTSGVCGDVYADDRHVVLESWDSNTPGSLDEMRATLGDRMPTYVGSMGYDGFETLFVPRGPSTAAMNAQGLPLDFYRSYNTTWHNASRFFGRYTDVPTQGILPCHMSRFYNSAYMKQYVKVTGDADGVESVNGSVVAKCLGGANGSWWFSPACRQNPDTCIPVIDGGDGWLLDVNMQRAAAYNMPFALAVGTWDHYASSPTGVNMLMYWWSPDTTFIDLSPTPVKFPENDQEGWLAGAKVTETMKVTLRKWTHYALPMADQRLMVFLERFTITFPRLTAMLRQTKDNKTEGQIACEWLKANPAMWMKWVPFETECALGFGMTDVSGAYVQNRSLASSCGQCRAGTHSKMIQDSIGQTSVCIECSAGQHQSRPGKGVCEPCARGAFAAFAGQSECQLCPTGQASDLSGATACERCAPGSFQAAAGKTACEACEPGGFQAGSASTACDICPLGSYSVGNSTVCENCTAGRISEKVGSSACVACEAGRYAHEGGLSLCSPCDVGEYAADVGLTVCEKCAGGAPLWTTMRRLEVQDEEWVWVSTDGAVSEEACGCEVGARLDEADRCIPCEKDGIVCSGMGLITVLPGYYSPANFSLFKCRNRQRCPGGPPGDTCAPGRVGVSCTNCLDGMAPADNGGCEPCGAFDTVPFAASCVAVVLACVLLYTMFERSDHARSRYAMLIIGMSLGLMLGLMQQLSVMGLMNVTYTEPMETLLKLIRVVAFDIDDVLRLGCVGAWSATTRFAAKLALVLTATVILFLSHVVVVTCRHGGRFRKRRATLVASLASLWLVFFTSVTVLMLQPFQCILHPNGKWTVSTYEDVICWSSDSVEHHAMIVLSVLALFMPLTNYVIVIMLVRRYPQALRRTDTEFLRSFGFLFFRFRPQMHWYILAIMTRSLFIGFVPVVPRASAQIYLLQVALIASFALVIHYKPWRVPSLNWLDVFFGAIMLVFLNIASFMALVAANDVEVLGWMCVTMAVLAVLLIPAMLALSVLKRLQVAARRYQFFLCHHKAEAGAFARWLKIELVGNPQVTGDTFLDSDNLDSLHQLLNFVATDVRTVVVLGTRDVYSRPWCIGEMATAHKNSVNSVILAMPGYAGLGEAALGLRGVDVESLLENGISMETIRKTLEAFAEKPEIHVGDRMNDASMAALAELLTAGVSEGCLAEVPDAVIDTATAIVANTADFEAMACAHVLRAMLAPQVCDDVAEMPRLVEEGQELPASVEKVIAVCTSGCFEDGGFVQRLLFAQACNLQVLPVIMEEEFQVPGREALEAAIGRIECDIFTGDRSVADMAHIVLEVFKEIAVNVNAKRASASVLNAAVTTLGQRLRSKKAQVRTSGDTGNSLSGD